ncbi:MAG TPA: PAS domain S-box protein, partial [Chloroflexota bacterium]|nr:PAS domain S-box protein [Chloroflexota bacterium]
MDSTYLTSGRAARRLGIAKGTLLRAMRRGEITPASRTPGGTFRFRVADVEDYARRLAAPAREPCTPEQPLRTHDARPAPPAEGRYQALVTALAQIVWTTSATGQVVDDVPLWRAYTGQSHEAIRGHGWLDAVHSDDRARTLQVWTHAIATGTLYETEYRLRRADSTYRPFLARAAPVRDEAGGVREWVGVCTDLADCYHSAADASALVETALDAIITINHADRVVTFNPAAEHIFGYQRGQVLGQELADLIIPPELRAAHRASLARYLATGAGALIGRRVEVT